MNVFVLNSGRCGSTTFIQACRHISNYSSAHESRIKLIASERLAYPANHIEADNRLSWILGRLQLAYGQEAFYVHLQRDPTACAHSFVKRRDFGIMQAYREGILMGAYEGATDLDLAHDYLDTVNSNIRAFLENKPLTMAFHLENARSDFVLFWQRIGAKGNLNAALAEWEVRHNESGADGST